MIEPYDEEVDRELMRGQMKVVCAWHLKLFGTEKVMREAEAGHEGDEVSHSICEKCVEIVRGGQNVLTNAQEIGQ